MATLILNAPKLASVGLLKPAWLRRFKAQAQAKDKVVAFIRQQLIKDLGLPADVGHLRLLQAMFRHTFKGVKKAL